jgi:hypothetical protein
MGMNRGIRRKKSLLVVVAGILACACAGSTALGQSSPVPGTVTVAAASESPGSASSSTLSAGAASGDVNQPGNGASVSSPQAEPPLYAEQSHPFKLLRPSLLNTGPIYPGIYRDVMASSADEGSSTDQAPAGDSSSAAQSHQSNSPPPGELGRAHVAEDANQPGSNFPPWATYSTQDDIDPRVKPNAGLRVPQFLVDLPGLQQLPPSSRPRLFPNFSPVVPDFDRTLLATRNWSVKVSLADFVVYTDPNSAKFNEFRDVHDGAVAGVEAHFRDGMHYLNVIGRNLGRKDEDLNIEGGTAGKIFVNFFDTQVPHNYMFGAQSLYSGVGTGNLTISNSIRTDIQNSTSITDANAKLSAYVSQQGQSVALSHEREKVGGDVTIAATFPWQIKFGAQDESRDGERPWSASFGFSEFVEIPWAVHYDQYDLHVSAEWSKDESRVYFMAGFRTNLFDNHVQTQTFSNPFRISDCANLVGTYDCGPATGRMALYPSNQLYEPTAMMVIKDLPWDSSLSWTLSAGLMYSNQTLQPFSTNTADTVYNTAGAAFNATDPAALPRATTEGKINTENAQLRWNAKPSDHLHLNLEYRAYRNDVTTPRFFIADFVREDQDVRKPQSPGDTFSNPGIGYTRQTATVGASYDIGHDSKIGLTYTLENWDRRYREVKYMDDNKVKVSYYTKAKKWLDLKSWYEHTERTASTYHFNQEHASEGDGDEFTALPMLHKFDEAPYHKDDVQVMATFALGDSMSVSTHGLFGETQFDGQTFGVLNNSHQAYGVDYTYDASDRVAFFADYSYEQFHLKLHDRAFSNGDACDPYTQAPGYASPCNWFGIPQDAYNTAGVGMDSYLVSKRFHNTVSFTFSKTHGTQSYSGGGGVDDPFTPTNFNNVDSVTNYTINNELEYKFSKTVALDAGYQYEFWHDNDYNYVGFNYVNQYNAFNFLPIPGTNLLMGGLLPPYYHANLAYFRLKIGL